MITTSERAVQQLREQLVDKCVEAGIGFRINVDTDRSGNSTFSIRIDERRREDRVVTSDGISLFLSPEVESRIKDFHLDYSDNHDDGFFLKEPAAVQNRQS